MDTPALSNDYGAPWCARDGYYAVRSHGNNSDCFDSVTVTCSSASRNGVRSASLSLSRPLDALVFERPSVFEYSSSRIRSWATPGPIRACERRELPRPDGAAEAPGTDRRDGPDTGWQGLLARGRERRDLPLRRRELHASRGRFTANHDFEPPRRDQWKRLHHDTVGRMVDTHGEPHGRYSEIYGRCDLNSEAAPGTMARRPLWRGLRHTKGAPGGGNFSARAECSGANEWRGTVPPDNPGSECLLPTADQYSSELWVDYCRAQEGIGPIVLPSNYNQLDAAQQLPVVINLERVNRGETPVVGLSTSLDALAQQGADASTDPGFPPGNFSYGGSIWAGGYPSVLASDGGWMYADGPGSSNSDCTPSNMSGCWVHRDIILTTDNTDPLVGGGGSVPGSSYAFEVLDSYPESDLVWTWANELPYFAELPALEPLPPPTITSVAPSVGASSGDTPITISGSDLSATSEIEIGGVFASHLACQSDTACTALTSAGPVGPATVGVTTPAGTTVDSSAYTYANPGLAPRGTRSIAVSGWLVRTHATCANACSGIATLSIGSRSIGAARFSIAATKTATLSVKLNKAGIYVLSHAKEHRIVAIETLVVPGQAPVVEHVTLSYLPGSIAGVAALSVPSVRSVADARVACRAKCAGIAKLVLGSRVLGASHFVFGAHRDGLVRIGLDNVGRYALSHAKVHEVAVTEELFVRGYQVAARRVTLRGGIQ